MTKHWSAVAVASLGVRTDMETANEILGISRTWGYRLAKEGRYPVPVLKLGRKYVVPVAGLLKALGIDETKATA